MSGIHYFHAVMFKSYSCVRVKSLKLCEFNKISKLLPNIRHTGEQQIKRCTKLMFLYDLLFCHSTCFDVFVVVSFAGCWDVLCQLDGLCVFFLKIFLSTRIRRPYLRVRLPDWKHPCSRLLDE